MGQSIYSGSESYFLSEFGHFEDELNYQKEYFRHLLAEPALLGRVLDIGCGGDLPPCLQSLPQHVGILDGVDPDPAVMGHPHLKERWNAPLEKAGVPDAAYDLAYCYNVAEHIAKPRQFFENIRRVLKPGGVFWALTPHHRHMFCWLARWAELAGTKGIAHRRDPGVNAYSSYYRMNSRRQVLKTIRGLGFREARFHYYPAGWSQYFPKPMRGIAKAYDWARAYRKPSSMLIVAYRLELEK